MLELTALPSIDKELWVPMVQETDVLLVNGGDPLYLCYWMRQSGLADLLPSLRETVYVGLSAGSMVMAPNIGEDFVGWKPPTGGDEDAGTWLIFRFFRTWITRCCRTTPWPTQKEWAAGMPVPCYAIDDQTAIKVVDGPSKLSPKAIGNCLPRGSFFAEQGAAESSPPGSVFRLFGPALIILAHSPIARDP